MVALPRNEADQLSTPGSESALASFDTPRWLSITQLELLAVMSFARYENPTVTAGYTRTTLTQLQAVAAGIVY